MDDSVNVMTNRKFGNKFYEVVLQRSYSEKQVQNTSSRDQPLHFYEDDEVEVEVSSPSPSVLQIVFCLFVTQHCTPTQCCHLRRERQCHQRRRFFSSK